MNRCARKGSNAGPSLSMARPWLLALGLALLCVACDSQEGQRGDPGASRAGASESSAAGGAGRRPIVSSGRYRMARDLDSEAAELESIGYLAGVNEAPEQEGVIEHNRAKAFEGLNLLVSGHGAEAVLMDMDGVELHRWRGRFEQTFPDYPELKLELLLLRDFWRRVELFPTGELLAIYEGHALVKLNKHSVVQWAYPEPAHHDLFVTEDEQIYVLTRRADIVPEFNAEELVLEDFVTVLDADGRELRSVSILKALMDSPFAHFMEDVKSEGDIFHTNTIEVLDGALAERIPAFRAGNVLLSILALHAVVVLDMESERIVWGRRDGWVTQHQPTVLENGNMLVFDNNGNRAYEGAYGRSRVQEFDPVSGAVQWEYKGNPDAGFYSNTCGSCQRLPNGNTLITESDNGRAFEVTETGEIVWEYLNPHRAGPNRELIATLFEVVRLPIDFPVRWATGGPAWLDARSQAK